MKALEILKLCQAVDDLNTRPIIKDIQEAVKELTALQSNYADLECARNLSILRIKELESIIADLKKQLEPKSCNKSQWVFYGTEAGGYGGRYHITNEMTEKEFLDKYGVCVSIVSYFPVSIVKKEQPHKGSLKFNKPKDSQ